MLQIETAAPQLERKIFSRAVQAFGRGDFPVRLELDPATPDGMAALQRILRNCPQVQGDNSDRPKFDAVHGVSELVDQHQHLAVLRSQFLNSVSQIDAWIAIGYELPA